MGIEFEIGFGERKYKYDKGAVKKECESGCEEKLKEISWNEGLEGIFLKGIKYSVMVSLVLFPLLYNNCDGVHENLHKVKYTYPQERIK